MIALVLGFMAGTAIGAGRTEAIAAARLVGGVWLDALRMTIVPLVFALVVTGVADLATSEDHADRRIGRRLPLVLVAMLFMAGIVAALIVPPLLALFPLSPDVVAGLRANIPTAAPPPAPTAAEAIAALMPINVVASAAAGAIVPIVVFALILGLALGRIDRPRAAATLAPFRGLADAMVVIVTWVLRAAPIGIFALALTIGATAGAGAALALGHYIMIQVAVALVLTAISYLLVRGFGGVPIWRFARAIAPAQAVAAGTQSSIATLPAMLASAARIGVAERDAAVILPLTVAVFKVTAPSGSLLFGLALAWMTGVEVSPLQLAVAIPIAVLSTLTILGMPGVVSFFAAATPTAMALGAPIELLPILLAVDTIPDMFRTTANVTADVAVTAIVAPPGEATAPES
nr:cation:dicarboxylase symporter family transporter [Sphingomonas colocasiae]